MSRGISRATRHSPGTIGRVRGRRPWTRAGPSPRGSPTKTSELDDVGRARARQDAPEHPEHRLRDGDRPDGAVEVAALVPLAGRRRLHARQVAERPDRPDRARQRKVAVAVDLLQHPRAGDDGDDEADDVQDRESDGLAPGDRVADAAIDRVGPILGEPDDVRRRLAAGQPAAQPEIARHRPARRRATSASARRSRARTDRRSAAPAR